MIKNIPSPLEFFGYLDWLDGRPLLETIEPYRRQTFMEALYTFEGGRPRYNLVLTGRAKKNWKTCDLILAALYRLLVWLSAFGNDCFLLANDEGQAADDLELAKKLIEINPLLHADLEIRAKKVVRRDGKGSLMILPAGDVAGLHGKSYLFVGFDEIHAYRNWDLFEALAPDPTRPDALTWITSYASVYNSPGAPLYDLFQAGQCGDDPSMYFRWYAADFTTDPKFENVDPEQRANPSMASWPEGRGYLEQQKRLLPSHKFRRLHLNLPGLPDGAAFDADQIMVAIVTGRAHLPPERGRRYVGFVDMSGGSGDDACLAIAHREKNSKRIILDLIVSQSGKPPFNPRHAVKKFAELCKSYSATHVYGDKYGGETFIRDFKEHGIKYQPCKLTKHELYEEFEPVLNAGEVELLDRPVLQQQLLGLVWRGTKIDHQQGEHDDWANAVAGVVWLAAKRRVRPRILAWPYVDPDDPDYSKKVAAARARELEHAARQNSMGISRPRSGLSYYTGGDFGDWIRRG
jgi:phage terminase large subunit-like protein